MDLKLNIMFQRKIFISLAHKRIKSSGANFIVANDVSIEGAGFGSDKNQVIIVDGDTFTVPLTSKTEIAQKILAKIVESINER